MSGHWSFSNPPKPAPSQGGSYELQMVLGAFLLVFRLVLAGGGLDPTTYALSLV